MTEQVTESNKITAGYTVKIPVDGVPYASEEATIFFPITIPDGATTDDVDALGRTAMARARGIVADALGIKYEVSFDAIGVEAAEVLIKAKFEGTTTAPAKGAPTQYKAKQPSRGGGGGRGNGPTKQQVGDVIVLNPINDDIPSWVSDSFNGLLAKGGVEAEDNEVWDNRKFSPQFGGNGNPNAPWFKTSKSGVALDFGGDPV